MMIQHLRPGTLELIELGFARSEADQNIYYKVVDNRPFILILYVDDVFLIGDESFIFRFKRELNHEFEMKDLG